MYLYKNKVNICSIEPDQKSPSAALDLALDV